MAAEQQDELNMLVDPFNAVADIVRTLKSVGASKKSIDTAVQEAMQHIPKKLQNAVRVIYINLLEFHYPNPQSPPQPSYLSHSHL